RNYKISRIKKVSTLPESFDRPKDFQLGQVWHESKVQFAESLPTFEVKVLVHRSIIGRIHFTSKFVQIVGTGTPDQEDYTSYTLQFNTEQEAIEYILGFSSKMKVVEPVYLVDQIVERAKAVIEMYVGKS